MIDELIGPGSYPIHYIVQPSYRPLYGVRSLVRAQWRANKSIIVVGVAEPGTPNEAVKEAASLGLGTLEIEPEASAMYNEVHWTTAFQVATDQSRAVVAFLNTADRKSRDRRAIKIAIRRAQEAGKLKSVYGPKGEKIEGDTLRSLLERRRLPIA